MTEEELDEWPCLQHGQCKYFNVNADRETSTCKRIDHKKIKFAKPWFKSYDCGQYSQHICAEFEPRDSCKWLKEHWDGVHGYFGKSYQPKGMIWFTIGEDTSVRYGVPYKNFWDGSFVDFNGELNWIEKMYYKRTKGGFGYSLIREKRNVKNENA